MIPCVGDMPPTIIHAQATLDVVSRYLDSLEKAHGGTLDIDSLEKAHVGGVTKELNPVQKLESRLSREEKKGRLLRRELTKATAQRDAVIKKNNQVKLTYRTSLNDNDTRPFASWKFVKRFVESDNLFRKASFGEKKAEVAYKRCLQTISELGDQIKTLRLSGS